MGAQTDQILLRYSNNLSKLHTPEVSTAKPLNHPLVHTPKSITLRRQTQLIPSHTWLPKEEEKICSQEVASCTRKNVKLKTTSSGNSILRKKRMKRKQCLRRRRFLNRLRRRSKGWAFRRSGTSIQTNPMKYCEATLKMRKRSESQDKNIKKDKAHPARRKMSNS